MKKARIKIPILIEAKILYRSASTCCVCRDKNQPVEIHHIDQDPSNNAEENLIVLCRNHHGDAHSERKMSINLTPRRLIKLKSMWEEEVRNRSSFAMIPQSFSQSAMWTYINHQRLPSLLNHHSIRFNDYLLDSLQSRKVVDKYGFITFKKQRLPSKKEGLVTIYDRFDYDDAQRLHYMYANAVDSLILASPPIEAGAVWSKTAMKANIVPGSLLFALRGFRFKRSEVENGEEDRLVTARSHNIEIRFTLNTRHMYGNSALYSNFVNSAFCASLIIVRSLDKEESDLIINGTPIAMGYGFMPYSYQHVHALRYGWAQSMTSPKPLKDDGEQYDTDQKIDW